MTRTAQIAGSAGFTLPVVLTLALLSAMLASAAFSESFLGQSLATAHDLQQRAFRNAEWGLARAATTLRTAPQMAGVVVRNDEVRVLARTWQANTLTPGFSSNRFTQWQGELQSESRAARGARSRIFEGLHQLQYRPASCDPPTGAPPWPQPIAQQLQPFGRSVTELDTNADGKVDRIYAGNRLGQLWRFDIHWSASSPPVMHGSVFADLRNVTTSRGFVAAPDVTLLESPEERWLLQIAIGTANTVAGPGANHFFLVHDNAPFALWTAQQHALHSPLTLTQMQASPAHGFALDVGADQVIAQSLTVNGKVLFTRVRSAAALPAPCAGVFAPSQIVLAGMHAIDGSAITTPELMTPLPGLHSADLAFSLVRAHNADASHCAAGPLTIPDCQVDHSLQRQYWRREGAD